MNFVLVEEINKIVSFKRIRGNDDKSGDYSFLPSASSIELTVGSIRAVQSPPPSPLTSERAEVAYTTSPSKK